MKWLGRALGVLTACVVALGVSEAEAQTPSGQAATETPPADARALFMQGQESYRNGDYATALRLWEQAVALDPRPALHYNIAQAHGRLGHIEAELASLRRFLDGATQTDPVLPSARARVTALEERIAQTGIVLSGSYEGARVILDGDERGTMPLAEALSVRPGSHAIDVELDGYQPFHAAIVVPAGERVTVTVALRRAEAQQASGNPMTAPIALYTSGGALVLVGGVFGTVALVKGLGSVEGTSGADRARTFSIVADATLGAGAVLVATGLVLHLTRRGDDDAAEPSVAVVPVMGMRGIGVVGSF